ncbi:unnamed protein product [Adineta steineri]|uniref:Nucleotidyl transferase domain-containing protein n=1 Tax=Adineta steineri TaxID=433720 RepID=A0A819V3H0_9BILA|nr:unnamed protein product [Adineta steineri]CAF4093992.1 unnamed protein product [Adineta steineri]
MKVVILAGGAGTRLAELTDIRPKPMVEIGGKPILWHIMKLYSFYGFNEFVILLGYKGYIIKEYFIKYSLNQSDITIDLQNNDITIHDNSSEPWKITFVDTGIETMTGGRIKRAQRYIGNEPFLLTYGDGVSNVNIKQLVEFHQSHGKLMTVTTVQSLGRFGVLNVEMDGTVRSFQEKPEKDGVWINAGFFVCQSQIFDYIQNDDTVFEKEPLETVTRDGQLMCFKHDGFWQCMDTLHDKNKLEQFWKIPTPPWKVW